MIDAKLDSTHVEINGSGSGTNVHFTNNSSDQSILDLTISSVSTLTVNLGLRWDRDYDLNGGPEQAKARSYLRLKAINSPFAGGLPHDDTKDFSPRVGLAYDPAVTQGLLAAEITDIDLPAWVRTEEYA